MRSTCLVLVVVGLLLILALGGFILLTLQALAPLSEEADAFLTHVGASRYEEAYASTSTGYRSRVLPDRFVAAMRALSLDQYASSTWPHREQSGEAGKVVGTITTRDGSTLPLTIELVHEEGAWRVSHLVSGADESEDGSPPVPQGEALQVLVMEYLRSFLEAVEERDFTAFHAGCSRGLQRTLTPEELAAAFAVCLDGTLDVRCILSEKPALQEPVLDEGASGLQVQGTFPEGQLHFEMSYVPEGESWKLHGLQVEPVPGAERLPMPDPEALVQLVEQTLLEFNRAVTCQDFTAFHATTAEPFRLQNPPAALLTTFVRFVEQGIDISAIEGKSPILLGTELTETGGLEVTGSYPEQGVQFELAFFPEVGSWKIVSIEVSTFE